MIEKAKADGSNKIDGKTAFKLYDTYGFPIELTKEYAADEGLSVDEAGFEAAMTEQQNRARKARDIDNGMGVQTDVWTEFKEPSKYVGYTDLEVQNAKVIGLAQVGQHVEEALPGDKDVEVILTSRHFMPRWVAKLPTRGTLSTTSVIWLAALLTFSTRQTSKTCIEWSCSRH